jgi:hypothetical protein
MDNDETIEEKTLDEIVEEYTIFKKMWHFEGDTGMKHLNTLTRDMGYKGHGFEYGSSLEAFLSDNPGAQEAIVNWIRDQNINDWKEELESCLPAEDESDVKQLLEKGYFSPAEAIKDIKPDFAAIYGCREGEPGQRGWDPTKEGHG